MTRAPASGDDAPAAGPFAPSTTGAAAVTRYVGGTTSGAPVAGTFDAGDWVIDRTGRIWICTVAGTPGTWVDAARPDTPPEVPATPTAQDIADALITLGFVTQAS